MAEEDGFDEAADGVLVVGVELSDRFEVEGGRCITRSSLFVPGSKCIKPSSQMMQTKPCRSLAAQIGRSPVAARVEPWSRYAEIVRRAIRT